MAWGAVVWNVLVIVWGSLVRATGSGAGCGNHWPLCNGEVVPLSPRVDTMIEFTHRCMTGGATVVVLTMLVVTFRATRGQSGAQTEPARPRRALARWAAVASMVLLLNEAVLGAMLVKLGYVTTNRSVGRVVLLSVHLSNTLLLMAAVVVTAAALQWGVTWSDLRGRGSALLLAGGGLLATLAVGVSGSLAALGDTLFPSSSLRQALAADLSHSAPFLLRIRWVHPVSAVLASVYVLWLMRRGLKRGLGQGVKVLGGLLVLQFVLGGLDVVLLAPVSLQLLHLAGADAFWIALVTMSLLLVRSEASGAERARADLVTH